MIHEGSWFCEEETITTIRRETKAKHLRHKILNEGIQDPKPRDRGE